MNCTEGRIDLELPVALGDRDLRLPDEGEVEGMVPSLGVLGATRVQRERARWKPGQSVCASFVVDREQDGPIRVAIKRFVRPGDAEAVVGRVREGRSLVDGRTVAWVQACDRRLPGIERLFDPRRTGRRIVSSDPFPGLELRRRRTRAHVMRYKPERRAVVRLDLTFRDDARRLVERRLGARVLPTVVAASVVARRQVFERCGGSTFAPTLVDFEERVGVLLERWLPCRPYDSTDFSGAAAVGALLAKLHTLPSPPAPRGPRPFDPDGAAEMLERVSLAEHVEPHRRLALRSGIPSWVHGDVHPDQFARADGADRLLLLDLDVVGGGDPAADLASWIADVLGADPHRSVESAGAELLDGYRSAGGSAAVTERLVAWVAAGLVARAAAALRRLQPGAPARAASLVALASDLVPRGGGVE